MPEARQDIRGCINPMRHCGLDLQSQNSEELTTMRFRVKHGMTECACHPEVPKARHNTRNWLSLLCHPELVSGSLNEVIKEPPTRKSKISTLPSREGIHAPQAVTNSSHLTVHCSQESTHPNLPSQGKEKHAPKELTDLTSSKKAAFTLAEVLITLAIIGIVAALTIPTLVQQYKKKMVETKLVKFYSTINQAIKMSEVVNGPINTWSEIKYHNRYDDDNKLVGYYSENTEEWFNLYFSPYIKVLKIDIPVNDAEGSILVYFPDGSLLSLSKSSWIFFPEAKDYQLDDTKTGRIREHSGIKYFTFQFRTISPSSGVSPYNEWRMLSDDELKTNSVLGCKKTMPTNERAYCTLLISRNGWKIPKDYPLKF